MNDAFIIWDKGEADFMEFLDHLNTMKPTIKSTMETEKNLVLSFLDDLVKKMDSSTRTTALASTSIIICNHWQ